MKDKIINIAIISCVLYFGINWIADNPKQVKKLRRQMNHHVSDAKQHAANFLK